MASSSDITRILRASNSGDAGATDELLAALHGQLRALAADFMRRERAGHTLQPTALVHEAYLRLVEQNGADCRDRRHFMAIASEVIRRVLVDHARRHGAQKRGGGWERVELEDADASVSAEPGGHDMLALDEALEHLGRLHDRQRRIVELRYFGGLSIDETAANLDVSPATVKAEWALARAWLREKLEP